MPLSLAQAATNSLARISPHVNSVARHYRVNQQQPCSIYGLILRCGHDVAFDKGVPQFRLGPKAKAAD
ncbi:hypothetical protein V6N12_062607 [Hibiscus sabdariffa]|uniref:Uncharacterized protein n=1 Tax=Hibiscus sabdariffa TaxID=183260 RepID=A0ABR2F9C4_9ROSI